VLGALLPSALAVLAVAALVTSLAVWRAEEARRAAPAAGGTTAPVSRAALSQAPPTTAAPMTTVPVTTAPATPASATPKATSPTKKDRTPRAAAAHDVEVVVLNQTTRRGLAASVAVSLRGQGWTVPAVGNFRGVVPATTVYYPPGEEEAALAAARSLPTAPRIRPRFGNLSTSRLTVVLTSSYPG
jgi:hypothetical protein